jgi:hypothetical protein
MLIPILTGPLLGLKWIAGFAPGKGKGLSAVFNVTETKQLKMVMENVSNDDICYDVGANTGLYTILFARYGKRVYAFEPHPRGVKSLYSILKINHINNGFILPCGVSSYTGLSSIVNINTFGASSIQKMVNILVW